MLTVICGPMFSGKTSALISMCMSHIVAGDAVTAFKPARDNRYDEKFIVSHNLDKFSCILVEKPLDIFKTFMRSDIRTDVVAIDEVQFLEPNTLMELMDEMFKMNFKRIICAGLAQDYKGLPFGAMPELLSMADEIVSLKAVCSKCKKIGMASRTYRKPGVDSNEQVLVGGKDIYEARCFDCWMEK